MIHEDVKKIGKTMKKDKVDKWVKKYKKEHPEGTHGWLYGCDILCKLLDYDGADGIWFFKGINEDGEERLVLYPADKDGNILGGKINSLGAMASNPPGNEPADDGKNCPPNCPE